MKNLCKIARTIIENINHYIHHVHKKSLHKGISFLVSYVIAHENYVKCNRKSELSRKLDLNGQEQHPGIAY